MQMVAPLQHHLEGNRVREVLKGKCIIYILEYKKIYGLIGNKAVKMWSSRTIYGTAMQYSVVQPYGIRHGHAIQCGPAVRYTALPRNTVWSSRTVYGTATQYKVSALDINAGRAAADVGLCFESHPIVRWPGTSQICG
jgi:hypothetical protein